MANDDNYAYKSLPIRAYRADALSQAEIDAQAGVATRSAAAKRQTEIESKQTQSTEHEALITDKIRVIQGDYIRTAQSVLPSHRSIIEMDTILQRMACGVYPTKLIFWDSVEYGDKGGIQEQYTAARNDGNPLRANNIYRSVFNIGCKKLVLDKWALTEAKDKLPPADRYV